jgi:hypothetical protein
MPQFDFYSFSGQVLWTLIGFLFFYFFILKYYIVSFSEIFKIRQKLYNQKKYKIDDVESYKKKLYTAFFKN